MWDQSIASPFGRLSIRKLLFVVTAFLVTTFAYIFVSSPLANAADATWQGDTIVYDTKTFEPIPDSTPSDGTGIAPGTKLFRSIQPSGDKADILYFVPASTDPATATSANVATYNYTPPGTYANQSPPKTISLDVKPGGGQTGSSEGTTSCDSTFTFGIGWIVCPVTKFLANGMDFIYNIIASYMTVRPVESSQENVIYRTWAVMRSFANVAFVIAFLLIIYSQITNAGISNYGIKKVLPRLIVAAILVNVSYIICQLAIDLSNISGYAVQELLIGLRNAAVGPEGNNWEVLNFGSVASFILAGGVGAAALGVGTAALISSGGAAILLLLPILVSGVMSVLIALVVIAGRQALITILVIVSPLAFVAYILPNTEKYFDKWRDLFMTMMIMFPAFSLVFGGSQLAATAIVQNANSINVILLGMAVQVAPLAITPLLLRFSGSLLTKVGGLVNNPRRGLVDRTRNWANERKDEHQARAIAKPTNRLYKGAAAMDRRKRNRKLDRENYDTLGNANYAATQDSINRQKNKREAEQLLDRNEKNSQAAVERMNYTNPAMQQLDIDVRQANLRLENAKAKTEGNWQELLAGNATNTVVPAGLAVNGIADYLHGRNNQAQEIMRESTVSAAESRRKQNAERVHSDHVSKELLKNDYQIDGQNIREYAGGINGQTGTESVLAAAVAAQRKEFGDVVNEKKELMNHFNLSSKEMYDYALGTEVTVTKDGVSYTFRENDEHAREAAITNKLRAGSTGEIETILKETGRSVENYDKNGQLETPRKGLLNDYADTISRLVVENSLPNKAAYYGSRTIDDIAQGRLSGDVGLYNAAAYHIKEGKMNDTKVASQSGNATEKMMQLALNPSLSPEFNSYDGTKKASFTANALALQHSAWRIVHDPRLLAQADDHAKGVLKSYMVKPPESENPQT